MAPDAFKPRATTDLSARRDAHRAGGSRQLDHAYDRTRGGPRMHPDVKRRTLDPDPRYELGGMGVPEAARGVKRAPHRADINFAMANMATRDGPCSLGSIAGYGGHIPGKVAENVVAVSVQKANELATATRNMTPSWNQLSLRPGTDAPMLADRATPTGPGTRTSADASWRMQHYGADGTGPLGNSGYTHTIKVPRGKPEDLDLKGAATPGYQGYIPGKAAENVYGQPFARTNRIAQDRRLTPAYTYGQREAHGSLSQTAPCFWLQGSDYPTIRNSMAQWQRNGLRSDVNPFFTEKEREEAVQGNLHRSMGFKSASAPSIHRSEFMWTRPRRRDAYEREISYQPPDPPYQGRIDPLDVAKTKGAAGEPSHTLKMDQMRHRLEYIMRNPDREYGTRV